MSEQINKVLASTAQAFSTAEQKQARDNIGAQASGNYVEYSAISGDSNVISSINGSALSANAGFSGVWHTPAFTGSGTNSSDKLGLNSAFTLSNSNNTAQYTTYSFSGLTSITGNYRTSFYGPTGVDIKTDLGGSTAHCYLNNNGVVIERPLPGDDWVSSYFSQAGIAMYGNFAGNGYTDDINSSRRFQGTGDTGNGMVTDIGFFNGDEVVRYPYIQMYTPGESATIYMSSISSWNNKLGSVNVGTGLSGDGVATPIAVTGYSSKFEGYHTDYYASLVDRELTFSAYNKDSSVGENKCVFNEHGMRLSSFTGNVLMRAQTDAFQIENSATEYTATLDEKKLRMSDSASYADLTKSSIDAINAVYNWATSQGMQPI